jgi:hypothetical protein
LKKEPDSSIYIKKSPNWPFLTEKYLYWLGYYSNCFARGAKMKSDEVQLETEELSSEKAYELGKTLSKGGISLPDSETAFPKKCRR